MVSRAAINPLAYLTAVPSQRPAVLSLFDVIASTDTARQWFVVTELVIIHHESPLTVIATLASSSHVEVDVRGRAIATNPVRHPRQRVLCQVFPDIVSGLLDTLNLPNVHYLATSEFFPSP